MAVQGPTICGTGTDGGGPNAWASPGNITQNDGSFASVTIASATSNELKATGYGFNIPAGATVIQVQVDIVRMRV